MTKTILRKGVFLIANTHLNDPNFCKTVVLLCEYSKKGAFGLILNRELNASISDILPDNHKAAEYNDNVFFGGPVNTNNLFYLHNIDKKHIRNSTKICEGVYMGYDKNGLDEIFSDKVVEGDVRFYIGSSCWSPGQLDNELKMNDWIIIPAIESLIFYRETSNIWWDLMRFINESNALSKAFPPNPTLN